MNRQTTRISPADVDRQRDFCQKLHERFAARPSAPLAFVDTYGCQQNEADSERLRGYLSEMGYQFTQSEAEADLIVINTCAIREHAEMRVLGNVGALVHTKRAKPGQLICVCGCMAQEPHMAQKIKDSYRQVDLVFGPHALWRFPELLYRLVTRRGRIFDIADEPGSIAEGIPLVRQEGVKAWVSIMYGCNNFCTYCIVPYVRGRERSRRPEIILDEIRGLVAEGYKDITLLGQNVNGWHGGPGGFGALIRALGEIDGLLRIRYTTSHPNDMADDLIEAHRDVPQLMPYLHLPVQSGSDRILKAMNRKHTADQYLRLIDRIRAARPDILLTSDFIVGFPGETDQDHADTLRLIEQVGFGMAYSFKYSPRPGTPAYDRPEVDAAVADARLQELQALLTRQQHAVQDGMIGRTVNVLFEKAGREAGQMIGKSDYLHSVFVDTDRAQVGDLRPVRIIGSQRNSLHGELVA